MELHLDKDGPGRKFVQMKFSGKWVYGGSKRKKLNKKKSHEPTKKMLQHCCIQ